ncbi:hypothetical protein [Methylobacterium nonmethylotrophicum]|uniref:Antitoxin SocA-like Panacea domain-containing protein n=1 Tax=Methylobacterium nonmethylotrophicum TaxID=1141884 RepID=A0A4Z0NJF2_9HYPH|nr:hypothetical protein [Methylobacterium nonmethylotrophicum]TGD95861.1 hypothetical protein EU555_26010 [Methylobacterium nonmethylotrophicum]
MTRRDLLLSILAAANGQPYEPVQIQKATFLVLTNLPWLVDEGPAFAFEPYDYGPFDRAVYAEAEQLARDGLAVVRPSPSGRWKTYAASDAGVARGREAMAGLAPEFAHYVDDIARWVRAQDFGTLVRSIYEAYPGMRANSVFVDHRR